MPRAFADTSFWLGRNFPNDQWHRAALDAERQIGFPFDLITTQEVLTEFLAHVSGHTDMRQTGVGVIERIYRHPNIRIVPQSAASFAKRFELYRDRMDKGHSLVDCISMITMDELGISLVLTIDHHFEPEGRFIALMRR